MLIKKLSGIEPFIAGDETLLREVFNPFTDVGANIQYSLAHAVVKPGQTTLLHQLRSSEIYYILQGIGEVCINDEKNVVGPNELVYIPPMGHQCIKNIGAGELIFLCICDPAWRKEDEVIDE